MGKYLFPKNKGGGVLPAALWWLLSIGVLQYDAVDRFHQVHDPRPGHQRYRLAVYHCETGRAVIAVQRDADLREVLVIQVDCQRNFLLAGGLFVGEAVRRQGLQGALQARDILLLPLVGPGAVLVLALGGEGVVRPLRDTSSWVTSAKSAVSTSRWRRES